MLSRNDRITLAWMVAIFLACYYLPVGHARFDSALLEALQLVRWYAREHMLLCLVPAFYIAGAISTFIRQEAILRYLGPAAPRPVAYGVASISGTILAVCSCTVLPLFSGIYMMGAGLGPATAFLYSGPAINVLAILLTARVLGLPLGIARAVGAILFSVVIGLLMALLFRRDERRRQESAIAPLADPDAAPPRPLWQNALHLALLVAILIFANWGRPPDESGLFALVYRWKWWLTALSGAGLGLTLTALFQASRRLVVATAAATIAAATLAPATPLLPFAVATIGLSLLTSRDAGELGEWFHASWEFSKQILPLLLAGVFVAGLLLGRPDHGGLVPAAWVVHSVGGESLGANLFAAVAGALMYFATLTEIPILEGLLHNGMGSGPALALLLAGPALSLPNMLVIRSVLGTRKTVAFILLVVTMATISGLLFGHIFV
jgi:uncharacterized membrane protein YraQ (UPF0718 family)